MNKVYTVLSSGYFGETNDGPASSGVIGTYSSKESAKDALMNLMKEELNDCHDIDTKYYPLEVLSFEEISALWSEKSEDEDYLICETVIDEPLYVWCYESN